MIPGSQPVMPINQQRRGLNRILEYTSTSLRHHMVIFAQSGLSTGLFNVIEDLYQISRISESSLQRPQYSRALCPPRQKMA